MSCVGWFCFWFECCLICWVWFLLWILSFGFVICWLRLDLMFLVVRSFRITLCWTWFDVGFVIGWLDLGICFGLSCLDLGWVFVTCLGFAEFALSLLVCWYFSYIVVVICCGLFGLMVLSVGLLLLGLFLVVVLMLIDEFVCWLECLLLIWFGLSCWFWLIDSWDMLVVIGDFGFWMSYLSRCLMVFILCWI